MPQPASKSSSLGPAFGISGAIIAPLVLSIALFFGLQSSTGASAAQPISPAPGSSDQNNLDTLWANTKPSDYLQKNTQQLTSMLSEAEVRQSELQEAKAPYNTIPTATRQQALGYLGTIISDLDSLQGDVTSNNTSAQTSTATDLSKNIQNLNQILPSIESQLNVPLVNEDVGEHCGRAAADMVVLYYTKGQIPSGFGNYVSQSGTTFVSNGGESQNPLSAAILDQYTSKSGWTDEKIGSRSADQVFANVKASIDGGDPVIMYTDDLIYPTNHIIVITGYDESTKTFIYNNPSSNGSTANLRTTSSGEGHQQLTEQLVYGKISAAEQFYNHSFMIQSKYWN
jgi:hypothetical protein